MPPSLAAIAPFEPDPTNDELDTLEEAADIAERKIDELYDRIRKSQDTLAHLAARIEQRETFARHIAAESQHEGVPFLELEIFRATNGKNGKTQRAWPLETRSTACRGGIGTFTGLI